MTWSEKQLQELLKGGKIKGYSDKRPVKKVVPREKSKGVVWLEMNLSYWCRERALELVTEFRFHPERKWRFDFAIPEIMAAIEYEGIYAKGMSRHTSHKGYNGDLEKYNSATAQGWRVIRVSAKNYQTAIKTLNDIFNTPV